MDDSTQEVNMSIHPFTRGGSELARTVFGSTLPPSLIAVAVGPCLRSIAMFQIIGPFSLVTVVIPPRLDSQGKDASLRGDFTWASLVTRHTLTPFP